MKNLQMAEHKTTAVNGDLEVVKVWPTIQGEGLLTGTPAMFIRLAGCNLTCNFCDTDYTTNRKWYTVDELYAAVEIANKYGYTLAVITGGEPFRQNVVPLILKLLEEGYRVQVESNGTLAQDDLMVKENMEILSQGQFSICCSPKAKTIRPELWPFIGSLKYIVHHNGLDSKDGLPLHVFGYGIRVARPTKEFMENDNWKDFVFLQPADEGDPIQNDLNVKAALDSCLKWGYRISLQTHKVLGVE